MRASVHAKGREQAIAAALAAALAGCAAGWLAKASWLLLLMIGSGQAEASYGRLLLG